MGMSINCAPMPSSNNTPPVYSLLEGNTFRIEDVRDRLTVLTSRLVTGDASEGVSELKQPCQPTVLQLANRQVNALDDIQRLIGILLENFMV